MNVSTEQLFTKARTQSGHLHTPLASSQSDLFKWLKWGPTAANGVGLHESRHAGKALPHRLAGLWRGKFLIGCRQLRDALK